ncbi:MAG: ATP-binding protein [Bacteroidia bacterium]|nr:ATP-binding protein [Bacteroidia bacterium]
MIKINKKKVLYFLFGYIIIQFLWWEILLVKLHHQTIEKEKQLQALKITDAKNFRKIEAHFNQLKMTKTIMIVGEGTVFLILILFGFYRLLKAYEKELVVNEQQTHFLLSLPHEIKTPLSIIQLNLQTILQNEKITEEKKKHLTEKSLEELKRLHNIIEQLLINNKISKGKLILKINPINISEILKKHLNMLLYPSEKEIQTEIQDDLLINADEPLIQLLIQNLLSNAVKFSEKKIDIKLFSQNNHVILEISNDGNLIDKNERTKIFELFYRRPIDEENEIKGTGIGLYLVKQIADLHNIKLNVFNKNNYNVFQVVF